MSRWDEHLEPLLEQRYPALLAYGRVLCAGDQSSAEDLVQDAIVRAFASTRAFASAHHAENYIRKAMVSASVDGWRRRGRQARAYSRSAESAVVPGADAQAVAVTDVERALGQLSPRERACVVLRFYDDLSVAQVAQRLGLADGTVKRYLADASARLADTLGVTIDSDVKETVPVTATRRERS